MYIELKATLKNQLKEEPSFGAGFKDEAESVYKTIIETVVEDMTRNFTKERKDISFILNGIDVCDMVLVELNKYNNVHV